MKITKEKIIKKIKTVKDPELEIDIYTLGLIYDISITDENEIKIIMTLTTPFCPYGNEIITAVEDVMWRLKPSGVNVEITFEPVWEAPKGLREILGV